MGDSGRDQSGNPKPNFQPGIDVLANITVLGEGPRGTLAGQAEKKLQLGSGQPQIYAVGVKELWKVPGEIEPGTVYHTFGYPLGTKEFGGGFIYTMRDQLISLGLVVGLDYEDPRTDPEADDLLGLVAKHEVIVADNPANRDNCIIHATIMALDLSFWVENYNQGGPRGYLEILGGIIQQRRGPVGTMRNGMIGTGYQKNYGYDHRFRAMAPPFYPVFSKNTIVSWYE